MYVIYIYIYILYKQGESESEREKEGARVREVGKGGHLHPPQVPHLESPVRPPRQQHRPQQRARARPQPSHAPLPPTTTCSAKISPLFRQYSQVPRRGGKRFRISSFFREGTRTRTRCRAYSRTSPTIPRRRRWAAKGRRLAAAGKCVARKGPLQCHPAAECMRRRPDRGPSESPTEGMQAKGAGRPDGAMRASG